MHWRNSDFQIRYFLAGKCHTADEAYRLLQELREERQQALEHARFAGRRMALKLSWMRVLEWVPFIGPWASISVESAEAGVPHYQKLIDACVHEIKTIDGLLEIVAPHRKFTGLPDPEAYQAAQEAEWAAELKWRAENYLLTGGIPMDQLSTMRLHPAFKSSIWPHIQKVKDLVKSGDSLPARASPVAKLLEVKHGN